MSAPPEIWSTGDGSITAVEAGASAEALCRALEQGGILFFPSTPLQVAQREREFLLAQKQLEGRRHKNMAYRAGSGRLTAANAPAGDKERLRHLLHESVLEAQRLVEEQLPPYRGHLTPDYATFRPFEEAGRQLRHRARNDLLHVDSFPTRPTHGDRILRVFTNLHPTRPRVWRTSEPLDRLVVRFKHAVQPFVDSDRPSWWMCVPQALRLRGLGPPSYDRWMLNFHHFLKENAAFQRDCRKSQWSFPPMSSWMAFTDMVSHAVISGQHALEQSFFVGQGSMVAPELTPLNVLRRAYARAPSEGPAQR